MGCIWCCTRLSHLMSPGLQDIKNRRELFMEPYAKAIKNSHVLTIHGKADETVSSQGPCAACLSIGPLLACLSCLKFTSGVAPAAKALVCQTLARSKLLHQTASGLACAGGILSARMPPGTLTEPFAACRFLLRMRCPTTSNWPRVSWCWWMVPATTSTRAAMLTF